ncbi:MAG: ABC transporter permease [Anaerolineae bacterium]|nr:ABC transporter permease [Anaerolineae bacterium]
MSSFLKFAVQRLLFMLLTLVVLTATLYGIFIAMTTPEIRATLYMPEWRGKGSTENFLQGIIEKYGMRDPYPVQYARWVANLLRGDWGFSPVMNAKVLDVLIQRTPATAELVLFSTVLFIPLGLISGVTAGWKRGNPADHIFRAFAFVATTIPPFVLGLILLSIFYINLHWFPPGRFSLKYSSLLTNSTFKSYTYLLLIDSLLNFHPEVTLDILRHLVLPAFTLSLSHWATLGRVTRAAMIEELTKDYIVTARGKGLRMRLTVWRHAFRNALIPGLNSMALSTAMLFTGTFIVEIIFGYPGVSTLIGRATQHTWPDLNLAMGFAIYSILMVLPVMFVLDILQAVVDPRLRGGGDE